jgi:hypothetical protein
VTRARERPEDHDRRETAARAEYVDQLPSTGVHRTVGEKERRRELRELGVADRDLFLNRGDRNGQRLPIEITDRDGRAEEKRNAPTNFACALDCGAFDGDANGH